MRDYTVALWVIKLGALVNLWFVIDTPAPWAAGVDPWIVASAHFVFIASAYRCLFPVHYEHDVVFHDTALSSIFATRFIATIKEIAFIYLMTEVLRVLNAGRAPWVDAVSWVMVALIVLAECFVWGAVLLERFRYYFYEESMWLLACVLNTIASVYLYETTAPDPRRDLLLGMNALFAVSYLPFQILNLHFLWRNADAFPPPPAGGRTLARRLLDGAVRSMRRKNRRTDAEAWGGWVGLLWMIGYFATLVPAWMWAIARLLGR